VSPLLIVLAVGIVLHTIAGILTRTPEEDQTPLRWKAWHSLLTGLVSTALMVAVIIGYYLATDVLLPFWTLVLAADLMTLAWKLAKHHQRVKERRALQELFDKPSPGEAV
jgi:L-asparagine transporter-like permease